MYRLTNCRHFITMLCIFAFINYTLLKHWSRCLYHAVRTTATRVCMEWPIMSWGESSCCRMLQRASLPEPDVVTTLRRCYVNYTGFLFGSEWSSSLPVWCARHCAVKCLPTIHLVFESNWWSLQSSSDNVCAVPRMHNSFGDRSFGAVGPRIWKSLPRSLRTLDISYKHFKALLKTYMLRQGYGTLWRWHFWLLLLTF